MQKTFGRNYRLEWAFAICLELGIDDPVHWMETVDPVILDRWIAFKSHQSDTGRHQEGTAEQALNKLKAL